MATNTLTNRPVFRQHYGLRADGLRTTDFETRYNADGSIFSQVLFTWGYDAIGRLTDEAEQVVYGKANAPAPYSNHFAFDRSGNRTVEEVNGGYDGVDPDHRQAGAATVAYWYNEDDQLLVEQRDGDGAYETVYGHYDTGGTFHKGYDANGSLTEQHKGNGGTAMAPGTPVEADSYGWDLRGRMTSATVTTFNGGTPTTATTTYGYDSDGVRVSETTSDSTAQASATAYLNDKRNPTGYAKAVEERVNGQVSRRYVLGSKVEGQHDATNGTLYLLTDGHGSTRALLNLSGNVVEREDYDA